MGNITGFFSTRFKQVFKLNNKKGNLVNLNIIFLNSRCNFKINALYFKLYFIF